MASRLQNWAFGGGPAAKFQREQAQQQQIQQQQLADERALAESQHRYLAANKLPLPNVAQLQIDKINEMHMPEVGPLMPGQQRSDLDAAAPVLNQLGPVAQISQTPAGEAAYYNQLVGHGTQADPSAVREYRYFQGLDPEKQKEYLQVKRSGSTVDTGAQRLILDPMGNVVKSFDTQLAPSQQPEYIENIEKTKSRVKAQDQPRIAAETETSKAEAKDLAKRKSEAPKIIQNTDKMIGVLDQMLSHPGLDDYIGSWFGSAAAAIPGSSAANFEALFNQVAGASFLKGVSQVSLGAISEGEQKAVTAAESILGNRKVSAGAYRQALRDYIESLKRIRDENAALVGSPTGFKVIRRR